LRRRLDQQGSFEATGLQTIEPEQLLEESIANIGSVETPNTDTWPQVIVLIQFYERMSMPHTAMATNVVTSSGNPSIPITVVTTGEASPNLSSSVLSHYGLNRNYIAQWTIPIYRGGQTSLHT
jgi:hypothetical protein